MVKFIEITNRRSKTKRLIDIDHVVSISDSNGFAFVEFSWNGETFGIECAETYIAIYNELVACGCVLFGGLT